MPAEMSQHILISHHQLYIVYMWVTVLVPSVFLICYIIFLGIQIREGNDDPVTKTMPFWMNFLYPNWLDRLTLKGILRSFLQALGMTMLVTVITASVFVVFVGKFLVR